MRSVSEVIVMSPDWVFAAPASTLSVYGALSRPWTETFVMSWGSRS